MRPMLEDVRIQGLGVIDDAVLELAPGLTVVTGETGAGKTMVVTGLGLLFGGRADSDRVRPDARRSAVEGRVGLDPGSPLAARLEDAGAEFDDKSLILARVVSQAGRSRAYVGGRTVPVALLAEIAEELVAVHGQADQQRLLNPTRQRGALDHYAGTAVSEPLDRYESVYRRHREVAAQLDELTQYARERVREADMLRHGLAEIEGVEPRSGEDADLLAEEERLGHAEELRSAAQSAHEALLGDPDAGESADAVSLVAAARQALEAVRDHDRELGALGDRLAEVSYVLSDVSTELASYAESVEADPVRLASVQERRAALVGLTRKYGDDIDAVLAWAEGAAQRLAELDTDDERIGELRTEYERLTGELEQLAAELTAARTAAAQRFGEEVTTELAALAMPHARVSIEVRPGEQFGPHGVDEVEVRLAAHPGAPPLPLHKGASGGELSRVMLAIEVVFAGADPVPTFVFDEVDAGVGGKAAVEVGRRLARLARVAQVVVVTHLPQVAAFADQHLVVVKSEDGSVTSSGVTACDRAGRVWELSRMLAGLEDSELGRAHAEELLATADQEKARESAGAGVQ